MQVGDFVRSSANNLGIGKLGSQSRSKLIEIEYFVSPTADGPEVRRVPVNSLALVELEEETRVFWLDPEEGRWRAGRLSHTGTVPAVALGGLPDPPKKGDYYSVRFPNQEDRWVLSSEINVRWAQAIEDPTSLLALRTHDSPYWHQGRAAFVSAVALQRAHYKGLSGLASSSVELYSHQIHTVLRILRDPIPRYILADEVGLGKTIEAGIVVRQHLLDYSEASVEIVVPLHLVDQWHEELCNRFHLSSELGQRVNLRPHVQAPELLSAVNPCTLLIVDEAHQVTRGAYADDLERRCVYEALQKVATEASHVLLLSATPVLHNEDGFLAMLHLLDPDTYDLEDREAFRQKVQNRQAVADILRLLEDDVDALFLEDAVDRLEQLPMDDRRLSEIIDQIRPLIEADEDDAERQKAIRAIRVHIQETHRLHRRLIRGRRASDTINPDLPERRGEIEMIESPLRAAVFDVLEGWRLSASIENNGGPHEEEAVQVFATFVEAALSHPSELRRAFIEHLNQLRDTPNEALFAEEEEILVRGIEVLDRDDAAFLNGLSSVICAKRDTGIKCVVFLSSEDAARDLKDQLDEIFPTNVRLHDGNLEVISEFLKNDDVFVLVCDERSEEGINLQTTKACLVHADLPLSPNRIEQRIGRLDRLGAKHAVVSVMFRGGDGYATAWQQCLSEAIGVFDRSVASLQHVLAEVVDEIRSRLLHEGTEVFDDISAELSADNGSRSLAQELRKISAQEALDSIDAFESGEDDFFDQLEEYEYGSGPDSFRRALEGWTVWNLQCRLHNEGVNAGSVVRYSHQVKGRPTLLPKEDFRIRFSESLDQERAWKTGRHITKAMVFDRGQAERQLLPIARIGHPFVDRMSELVHADDRGTAFAFWRSNPKMETVDVADLYFRIDFVVEVDPHFAIDRLLKVEHLSRAAVRRRADGAFSPMSKTIWINADMERVTDDALLRVLAQPYMGKQGSVGHRDVALRPIDRWPIVDSLDLFADWETTCYEARSCAEKALREDSALEQQCCKAIEDLEAEFATARVQLLSRIDRMKGAACDAEKITLQVEEGLAQGFVEGIHNLIVKVDAAGAVFLSNHDPFEVTEA